jgi:hypothetical protein
MTPPAITAFGASQFGYGQGGFTFQSGNDPGTTITLFGLNPDGTGLPSTGGSAGPLVNYENFLFWQDRANSTIVYSQSGYIENSVNTPPPSLCTSEVPGTLGSLDNPCLNTLQNANSPQMNLLASPNVNMHGYIYQPRGAWLNLLGGGNLSGPLRIITGALNLQGGPTVILTGNSTPITITETALIE